MTSEKRKIRFQENLLQIAIFIAIIINGCIMDRFTVYPNIKDKVQGGDVWNENLKIIFGSRQPW